jgi:acetyl-CoA decarbonylase/synthase complex subunit gamma
VSHRDLVVPQLGAPGVSAHTVKKLSGFRVRYGPVHARDLPAYLDAGMKATPWMRRKGFPLKDRLVLIPIELVAALKTMLLLMAGMFFLSGFFGREGFAANLLHEGVFSAAAVLGGVLAGAVLGPVLLPWLPGRAFSTKGFALGLAAGLAAAASGGYDPATAYGLLKAGGWVLMISAMVSYLVMNFTGSSTYTSLSGVRREMRWALPLQIASGAAGLMLWLAARFFA